MNFDNIIERRGTDSIKYDKMKDFIGADDLVPMWVADMDFATPDFVMEAIRQRANHPILGYSFRPESFYNSVAGWMHRRHGWKVDLDQISFSPGVVPALYLALKGFSEPGDKIIVQPPVYFPFFSTIKTNQRRIIYNQLVENQGNYSMDFDDLKKKIDSKTKLIFVSNPHNPVGRCWQATELEELVEICYTRKVLIISDEIHSDLVFKPNRHIPIASINAKAAEITLTLMAPSKTFNLAGLSTSVVISQNPKLLQTFNEMLEATHLNMGNIFGNVAAEAAYNQGDNWLDSLLSYLASNIDMVNDFALSHSNKISMIKPEATYLPWIDFRPSGMNDNEIRDLFLNKAKIGINVGPLFGKGGSGFIRMNIAMPKSKVEEALIRLNAELIKL